jgi:hypothetical protein
MATPDISIHTTATAKTSFLTQEQCCSLLKSQKEQSRQFSPTRFFKQKHSGTQNSLNISLDVKVANLV